MLLISEGFRVEIIASADLLPVANRYHQQYLHKVPNGYCGIGGTNVS
ncbi:peptide methionine sulfoxide reductase MsrA [Sphaerisporangium rubeum]|uniref:Peptide methionine sulfoxide reductase MsrA n=1 Tax=Sphaerisporangium rubeum TaxID=321317 RepID=A0A7X0M4R0_9ACTN|nr:peptide methionine sulfoxide reductase MsrA [Sphaerisporangium rubeum]